MPQDSDMYNIDTKISERDRGFSATSREYPCFHGVQFKVAEILEAQSIEPY